MHNYHSARRPSTTGFASYLPFGSALNSSKSTTDLLRRTPSPTSPAVQGSGSGSAVSSPEFKPLPATATAGGGGGGGGVYVHAHEDTMYAQRPGDGGLVKG